MSENNVPSTYTEKLKEAIEAIPQEYALLPEETLRSKLDPDIKLYEVKRAYWEELCQAQDEGRKMRIHRIYDGIVSKPYFYEIIKNPLKMAWITSPLTSYENKTKAALDMVTERYNELITMDITTTRRIKDEFGDYKLITETDPKKALVLLQVIKNLEDRIKGTAVQRQVSVHTKEPSGQGIGSASLDMDAVEQRIAELEMKLGGENDGQKHRPVEFQQSNERDDSKKSRGAKRDDILDADYEIIQKDVNGATGASGSES